MRSLSAVALLFVALGFAACGGGAPESNADTTRVRDGEPGVEVPLDELRAMGASDMVTLDALHDELMGDGFLSHAEYERALLDYIQCMRDAGIEVQPTPQPSGRPFLLYGYLSDDRDRAEREAAPCKARFLPVDSFWDRYEAPGYRELLAEAMQEVADCLRDRGFAISDEMRGDEFDSAWKADPVALRFCLFPVKEKYGLLSWTP